MKKYSCILCHNTVIYYLIRENLQEELYEKKILAITLVLCLGLCACGKEETKDTAATKPTEEVASQDEKQAATTDNKTQSVQLSDDLFSFQFAVNDEVIQLPVKFQDLVSAGWVYDGDENEVMVPMDYIELYSFKKDTVGFMVSTLNDGSTDLLVKDSEIYGTTIYNYDTGESDKVLLPKNIELGVSTIDEVIAAYGEPTSITDQAIPLYNYNLSENDFVRFTFYEDVLDSVTINKAGDFDFGAKFGLIMDDDSDSDSVSLGTVTELMTYSIDIAGDTYIMPIQVSELIANGWELTSTSEQVVDDSDIILSKDDNDCSFTVHNYASEAIPTEECYIRNITAFNNNTGALIKLAGGIAIGTSKADLEEIISADDFTVETDPESSITTYRVLDAESELSGYWIYLMDDQVEGFEVNY